MDFVLFLLFHKISTTGIILLPIRIHIGLKQKGDFYKAKIMPTNSKIKRFEVQSTRVIMS